MLCHKCLVFGHLATKCTTKDDDAYEIELAAKIQASIRDNCGLKDQWGMLESDRPERLFHITPGYRVEWTDQELAVRRNNKKEQLAIRQVIVDTIRVNQGASPEP